VALRQVYGPDLSGPSNSVRVLVTILENSS